MCFPKVLNKNQVVINTRTSPNLRFFKVNKIRVGRHARLRSTKQDRQAIYSDKEDGAIEMGILFV